MADVGKLVQSLQADAELESPGCFTVNFDAAASPYRAFVQQYPGWPWLRLVQEALQQGAERLQIKTTRHTLACKFRLPNGGAREWLQAGRWLAGQGGEPPRAAVIDVLMGLVASPVARWRVALLDDQDEAFVVWRRGQGLQAGGQARDSAWLCFQAEYLRDGGWFGWGRSRLGPVQANLAQRCLFSPVPIEMDGELVNDPNWKRLPHLQQGRVELTCPFEEVANTLVWSDGQLPTSSLLACPSTQSLRALRYLCGTLRVEAWHPAECQALCLDLRCMGTPELVHISSSLQPLPRQPRLALAARVVGNRCAEQYFLVGADDCRLPGLARMTGFLELEEAVAPLLGLLHRIVVPLGSVGVSQLSLVRNGVVTDPATCDLGYSGLVALSADPRLKTDASGLQIVRDEGWNEVCKELRLAARQAVWEVYSLLEQARSGESIGLADSLRLELLTRLSSRAR